MKYLRKVNYYETDRMGITHHSNYIRFMEEARIYMMDKMNIPYSKFEEEKIMIPVIAINCDYKYSTTFDDELEIDVQIKKFNGVRIEFEYNIINLKTGNIACIAESKHCFTDSNLKPINLKKVKPDWYEAINNMYINKE